MEKQNWYIKIHKNTNNMCYNGSEIGTGHKNGKEEESEKSVKY